MTPKEEEDAIRQGEHTILEMQLTVQAFPFMAVWIFPLWIVISCVIGLLKFMQKLDKTP